MFILLIMLIYYIFEYHYNTYNMMDQYLCQMTSAFLASSLLSSFLFRDLPHDFLFSIGYLGIMSV